MKTAIKTIGNVTLDVHDAGEYNIDGKKIPYDAGIKIKIGKAKLPAGARDLLALKAILEDGPIRELLQERYNEEEEILKDMTF